MELILGTLRYTVGSILHNLPYLALGILIAGAMKVYIDPAAMKGWLTRKAKVSILGSVAFGAFTPLCACGTMAVILSMLATALPWGAVMAFLTSSPLMSPDEFVLIAGVVSLRFAIALTVSSIIVGLGSGFISNWLEKNTRFFEGQARMAEEESDCSSCGVEGQPMSVAVGGESMEYRAVPVVHLRRKVKTSDCCSSADAKPAAKPAAACGCSVTEAKNRMADRLKLKELLTECYEVGVKKILPYFAIFAGIGYMINSLVPQEVLANLFSAKNHFAVPLAALIGLPLYVNGASSVPLLRAFTDSGASGGALLAFMITGPGTSAGVMAGLGAIMKKRAIALYVGLLLVSGILLGYAYDLFNAVM